jgi:hypothetical protein
MTVTTTTGHEGTAANARHVSKQVYRTEVFGAAPMIWWSRTAGAAKHANSGNA